MKIAVNTRLLLRNKLEGIGWFTYETMSRISKNHPEHEFYFIFDRPFDPHFIFSSNVFPVVIRPQARHPFLFYWWFEKSIPKVLKKINADLFISPDGFLSLSTNVKSLVVFHDINFMHYPNDFPLIVRCYYRYYSPLFAKKASRIVTVSEYSKADIAKQFPVSLNNIDVVYNGANEIYKPLSEQEKREIKQEFTDGKDFFIFVGALNPRKNVTRLLKAFDLFKEKTKSDIKLIIVGERMFKTRSMKKAYRQMVFKDEVIFSGRMTPEKLNRLYGSALALTFVPYFEGFGIPIIEAMNCGTPVITSNVTSMPEVAGDAALLVNPFSVESITDAMIKIYADNDLRYNLIEKGLVQCQKFSWNKTAENFWESVEKVLNK